MSSPAESHPMQEPSSGSDYQATDNEEEAEETDEIPEPPSRASSLSRRSRKRSRSDSVESLPDTKRHLVNQYNDAYRALFNEFVGNAADRFIPDPSFIPHQAQIGLSKWSGDEKSVFFAALHRLGIGDIPGIAQAIKTKTIPEVQELLLLLQDAAVKHGDSRLTSTKVPAANEVTVACSERLELAGDALAWYQERFEAKEEKDRYGTYWLITPEIADEIEGAFRSSRASSLAASVPPESSPPVDGLTSPVRPMPIPEILQQIPEANLLNPSMLLTLSRNLFMNASPTLSSSDSHWTSLVSPLASKPSIYRTAFIDLHTLVLSLTKRLTQACIIQATSRIRSQGWRVKKGVNPLVKKRDVFTAIDALRLKRDGRERWRGVARRCGLYVVDGVGKLKRELNWDEVEGLMSFSGQDMGLIGATTDQEIPDASSGAEVDHFKRRARRSGTPLLRKGTSFSEADDESDLDGDQDETSSVDSFQGSGASQSSLTHTPGPYSNDLGIPPEEQLDLFMEDMDQAASQQEERRLWNILDGRSHAVKEEPLEDLANRTPRFPNQNLPSAEGWREWTENRAEWEEFSTPVPVCMFLANQKLGRPSVGMRQEDVNPATLRRSESRNTDEESDARTKRKGKASAPDIPIRGARAYAALQDRLSSAVDPRDEFNNLSDDEQPPVESIEVAQAGADQLPNYDMDSDLKLVLQDGGSPDR
ncbi:hypothetical protein BCR34DRAFT_596118 [Clohesyomyces aquaticus]|uniref:Uncharacterized protein n=1 Tax=Clohesyomyces aquaticus TaxID=1231657 RepID=A0A1Y2A7P2_9PLEO|nr:hypothetical protein BCR34DRAFT_596118 [Clohesyomyces aquaticus]